MLSDEQADLVLAELRLLREHVASLATELRARKLKAARRVRTLVHKRATEARASGIHLTELDLARARKLLRR
jgi:hypothetical protein